MQWTFPYASKRVPLLARNCVTTTQPLAAQAGLAMLAQGGNAVDAAVACAVALTVVEPTMNGIGGDAFAIVADRGELFGLNASGRSPAAWTPERFEGLSSMPKVGWNSVTVPGGVSAWVELHRKFGTLPFDRLVAPAIRYAEHGFPVTPAIADIWSRRSEALRDQPGFAETFLPEGRPPKAGEIFSCPHQATTLSQIADSGGEAFYRGVLAEKLASAARNQGGAITLEDLDEHTPEWVKPMSISFAGYEIHELPPNSVGLGALAAFGILDRLNIWDLESDDPRLLHLQIEATKLAISDVYAYVSDPRCMDVDPLRLIDAAYLDARAAEVSPARAAAPNPGRPEDRGTVYLATADESGMMVSMIQSNFSGFGSGVVVPETGISLHNRGSGFVTTAGHPNQVGPRKRPLNTIIPGFITRGGASVAAFGVMGGTMQPQGHVQLVSRLLAGQNVQAAIDAPRWRVNGEELWVEGDVPCATRSALEDFGHQVVEATYLDFGAAQVIMRIGDCYAAASESRRDGFAVGF